MAQPARTLKLSYQDYLAIEAETDIRHQFVDGEVFAMAGGTPRHSAVKVNLTIEVGLALRGQAPCRAYDSDLKIRVLATGLATYPDLAIICGPLERDPEDPRAATNPTVLAEVLSPSTEAWDRGKKFRHCQTIPSLQHYLLIDPAQLSVEHFHRQSDGSWRYMVLYPGSAVQLLEVSIPVEALFLNLPDDEP